MVQSDVGGCWWEKTSCPSTRFPQLGVTVFHFFQHTGSSHGWHSATEVNTRYNIPCWSCSTQSDKTNTSVVPNCWYQLDPSPWYNQCPQGQGHCDLPKGATCPGSGPSPIQSQFGYKWLLGVPPHQRKVGGAEIFQQLGPRKSSKFRAPLGRSQWLNFKMKLLSSLNTVLFVVRVHCFWHQLNAFWLDTQE